MIREEMEDEAVYWKELNEAIYGGSLERSILSCIG